MKHSATLCFRPLPFDLAQEVTGLSDLAEILPVPLSARSSAFLTWCAKKSLVEIQVEERADIVQLSADIKISYFLPASSRSRSISSRYSAAAGGDQVGKGVENIKDSIVDEAEGYLSMPLRS